MKGSEIIQSALQQTEVQIQQAQEFLGLESSQLYIQPAPGKWSINECFEHLNVTLDHYLSRMSDGIAKSSSKPAENFRSGMIGKKMWNSMLPREDGTLPSTMKTFKFMEPANFKTPDNDAINTFIGNMNEFKQMLESAKKVNLNKVRVTSAIGPILRFKLGDAIPFMINHNARHIWQAGNVRKGLSR